MNKVFLAAGHHPTHPGACFQGVCEHDIATGWVQMISEKMPKGSVVTVPSATLKDKAAFINARTMKGDIAVEVHFNSAVKDGKHVGAGACTLYYPGSLLGKELAEACQAVLSSNYPPDRGIVEGWYRGDKSRGAYFFLEKVRCPAVILEPQFIHLQDSIHEHAEKCCDDLAKALTLFILKNREVT